MDKLCKPLELHRLVGCSWMTGLVVFELTSLIPQDRHFHLHPFRIGAWSVPDAMLSKGL
jgi:hypothetical protein